MNPPNPSSTSNTVVLQCHPLEDSYNMALLNAVQSALTKADADVDLHRFYPDGQPNESLFDGGQHLIVVTPTWWGAMPAVIVQWIQEMLGPWIDGDRPKADNPLADNPLAMVRRLSIVTSHGSSKWINVLQGEPGRRLWKQTILPLCAEGADFDWIALYKIDRLDLKARQQFIVDVEHRIYAAVHRDLQ